MLLLLSSKRKQKDVKSHRMCMQILGWCVAINTINGYERLHKFLEEEECLLDRFSVVG